MRKLFLLIPILLTTTLETALAGSCSIENSTPDAIVTYLKQVDTDISDITKVVGSNNQCSGEAGSFTNERRFLDLIDRIDAQNSVFPDIVTDFQYRIMLVVNGDSRDPVMRQGEVWKSTEKKIIDALKSVGRSCAMDIPIGQGRTPESALTEMLVRNRAIESYYQKVALGNPSKPADMSDAESALYDAIALSYSPESTVGCKHDGGLEKLKEKATELLTSITNLGKNYTKANDNWKIALDLFRGTASNYNDTERRLLTEELSRQGITKGATDTILKSLDCMQKNAAQNASMEEWGKARLQCMQPIMIGGAESVKDLFKKRLIAKTTDQYLQNRIDYDRARYQASRDLPNFWSSITTKLYSDGEQTTNEKMLTDLVKMHIDLESINKLLSEKIPEMQGNCMKAQRETIGGCRSK